MPLSEIELDFFEDSQTSQRVSYVYRNAFIQERSEELQKLGYPDFPSLHSLNELISSLIKHFHVKIIEEGISIESMDPVEIELLRYLYQCLYEVCSDPLKIADLNTPMLEQFFLLLPQLSYSFRGSALADLELQIANSLVSVLIHSPEKERLSQQILENAKPSFIEKVKKNVSVAASFIVSTATSRALCAGSSDIAKLLDPPGGVVLAETMNEVSVALTIESLFSAIFRLRVEDSTPFHIHFLTSTYDGATLLECLMDRVSRPEAEKTAGFLALMREAYDDCIIEQEEYERIVKKWRFVEKEQGHTMGNASTLGLASIKEPISSLSAGSGAGVNAGYGSSALGSSRESIPHFLSFFRFQVDSFKDYLQANFGLTVRPVPGDGRCQFHSILLQLKELHRGKYPFLSDHVGFTNEQYSDLLRGLAIEYIEKERPKFEGYLARELGVMGVNRVQDIQYETFDAFIAAMSCPTNYGDSLTLRALSEMLECNIVVLHPALQENPAAIQYYVYRHAPGELHIHEALILVHNGANHYETIVNGSDRSLLGAYIDAYVLGGERARSLVA